MQTSMIANGAAAAAALNGGSADVAFTNTHPNDTVDIAASFTGATADAIRHGNRSLSADYLDPRNLQPLIDISAKYGLINKGFPAAEIISPAAVKPS